MKATPEETEELLDEELSNTVPWIDKATINFFKVAQIIYTASLITHLFLKGLKVTPLVSIWVDDVLKLY